MHHPSYHIKTSARTYHAAAKHAHYNIIIPTVSALIFTSWLRQLEADGILFLGHRPVGFYFLFFYNNYYKFENNWHSSKYKKIYE